MTEKITDCYLPERHLAEIETVLAGRSDSWCAPLFGAEEMEGEDWLRRIASPIDHCIRNLTAQYAEPPTYFVLSRGSAVNAFIGRRSGFQCIVVTEALCRRADALFSGLLADAGLVNFLRNGSEPVEPDIEPTRERSDALARLVEFQTSDIARTALRAQLFYLLMYALTAHELGHLALGHLDREPDANLDEAAPVQADSRLASRAREWDADRYAVGAALYLLGSDFANEPLFRSLITDGHAALRVLFVVIYVSFIVMDEASPQDRPAEERTHPRPLVRVGLAGVAATLFLELQGQVGPGETLEVARRALRSVEIAIWRLAGGVMDASLATKLTTELEGELSRLSEALNELLPSLNRKRLEGNGWAVLLNEPVPAFPSDDDVAGT